MTGGHEEWDEMLAGHALNALEPVDEQQLLAHAAGCETCSQTLRDFQDVAADLGRALPPLPPPPGGKERLMAAVRQQTAREQTAHEQQVREPAVPGPRPQVVTPLPVTRRPQPSTRPSWRSGVLAAAAALVLVLAGGVAYGWQQHHLAQDRASRLAAAEGLLHGLAAGHRNVALGSDNGTRGQVVQSDDHVWVLADGLAPNDRASSTYVLWATQPDGEMKPVTTFDVGSDRLVALGNLALPHGTSSQPRFAISKEQGRTAPATPSAPVLISEA